MFANMVESKLNRQGDAKQTKFFLGTLTLWGVVLIAAVTYGIVFFDAELTSQTLNVASALTLPSPPIPPSPLHAASSSARRTPQAASVRSSAVPVQTSRNDSPSAPAAAPAPVLPSLALGRDRTSFLAPPHDAFRLEHRCPGAADAPSVAPPPPPGKPDIPTPAMVHRSEGALRGGAIRKPLPEYPAVARQAGVSGDVIVELMISEEGDVVAAHVVSGPPLLHQVVLNAARRWAFQPTKLNGQSVKVTGVVTFRFLPPQ